jgi:hypothetical protein
MFECDMQITADLKTDPVYTKANNIPQIKMTFIREVKQRKFILGGKFSEKQIESLNQGMWWTCTIFGDYAEAVNTKGLKAGQVLVVEGNLYGNRWIGKDDGLQKSSWFTRTEKVLIRHSMTDFELIPVPPRKKKAKPVQAVSGVLVEAEEEDEAWANEVPNTVISSPGIVDAVVDEVGAEIARIRGKLTDKETQEAIARAEELQKQAGAKTQD